MEITERRSVNNMVCEKIDHFSWCDFVAKLFSYKNPKLPIWLKIKRCQIGGDIFRSPEKKLISELEPLCGTYRDPVGHGIV